MDTSALQKTEVEQSARGSRGANLGIIKGGARARRDRFKQNEIEIEPRYEIIDNVIYMMASPKYWHQEVFFKMALQLEQQLAPHGCKVMQAPFDVYLFWEKGDQKNFVEPDLFIACDQEQLKRLRASEQDYYHGAPKFIVEILSPSTGAHDLERKAELYYRAGVAEYWVVDPLVRTIHVFTMPEHGAEYKLKVLDAVGCIPLIMFPGVTIDFSAIFPKEPEEIVQTD